MKLMARKTKAHLKLRPKKVALPPVVKKDPLDEFKKTSPHYKFETTPGGQRMLSAPNDSELSLLNFQPFAQRALAIAQEHRLRIRPHSVEGRMYNMFYNLVVIFLNPPSQFAGLQARRSGHYRKRRLLSVTVPIYGCRIGRKLHSAASWTDARRLHGSLF